MANHELHDVAAAIAAGVGGSVRAVPRTSGDDEGRAYTVVMADGRMPVLLRAWRTTFGVSLAGRQWTVERGAPDAALVRDVVAAIEAWGAAQPAGTVTMFELALDLCGALSAALAEPWAVRIEGTFARVQMSLAGANAAASSVVLTDKGVNAGREIAVAARASLAGARAQVVAAAREQLAMYERNVATRERLMVAAEALAQRLAARVGGLCTVQPPPPPTYGWLGTARIACQVGEASAAVELRGDDGALRAHAGLAGARGWDGDVEPMDERFEPLAAAVAIALRTLTLDKLVVGRRYRVLKSIGGLKKGAIVVLKGFDDVDNHCGRYEFVNAAGKTVTVDGDFSTPHTSPLGDTDRFLEPTGD